MTTFPITIWYLEDNPDDVSKVKAVTPHLESLLEEHIAKDYAHERGLAPEVKINIIPFYRPKDLEEAVLKLRRGSADVRPPSLLLLDFFIRERSDTPNGAAQEDTNDAAQLSRPLTQIRLQGRPFFEWLKSTLPSVPYRVLTIGDRDDVGGPGLPSGVYVHKEDLNDEILLARKLLPSFTEREPGFWRELEQYAGLGVISWHTPGHNKGAAFRDSVVLRPFYEGYVRARDRMVFASDLSVSVPSLGDLSEPEQPGPMKEAMERAATIFGAYRTLFCTNGTSTSNKALLMTVLRPGESVVVDRNCHKSVHQAIVLAGALPVYLSPQFNSRLGLWVPLSETIIKSGIELAVTHDLKPRLLILTNCTYDGILLPIYEISAFAENLGLLVHADEAWFAYGRFHPFYGPGEGGAGKSAGRYNALDAGAHFCVHSSHKVLAAFSQASMLHIGHQFRKRMSQRLQDSPLGWIPERFMDYASFEHQLHENMRFWLSTSPHYPMIASLDAAAAQMGLEGLAVIDRLLEQANGLRDWARMMDCYIERSDLVGADAEGYERHGHDPLKFSVETRSETCSQSLTKYIRDKHQCEKSSNRAILFLLSVGTRHGQCEGLKDMLQVCHEQGWLGRGRSPDRPVPVVEGQVVVIPRDAHYAAGRYLTLAEALSEAEKGHAPVACHMVTPYPPGIPVLLPGLRVTPGAISLIETALEMGGDVGVHGLHRSNDENYIRVLTSAEIETLKERYKSDGTDARLHALSLLDSKL